MSAAPEVSVVIPTRARETRLAFALEALARQTLDPGRFEVIVVRAAGADGALAGVPDGLRVTFLEHAGPPGPGAQRNLGWRHAAAPLVAFTDDDCRPAPGWLEGLLAAAGDERLIVQGRTEPDPDERHLLIGLARSLHVDKPNNWYATCNIAYPRPLLERLGGFDDDFRFSAEDADLGLRARASGADRAFAPDALVYHAVLPEPLPRAFREIVARDATPRLIARHPEHRGELYAGVFWKRTHATLLLAALGIVAFRGRPLLQAASALPYLDCYVDWRQLARPRGAARVAMNLAGRLTLDALELVVTARGAIAERTLIL
ncbi:MAG TPA: glycosyltransferase [Solirubrobacterales bacterium]